MAQDVLHQQYVSPADIMFLNFTCRHQSAEICNRARARATRDFGNCSEAKSPEACTNACFSRPSTDRGNYCENFIPKRWLCQNNLLEQPRMTEHPGTGHLLRECILHLQLATLEMTKFAVQKTGKASAGGPTHGSRWTTCLYAVDS